MKEPETIDEHFMLVYAYLDGWNGVQFFPNLDQCAYLMHDFLNDYNQTREDFNRSTENNSTIQLMRRVTTLISGSFAETYLYCHMLVVDTIIYYELQVEIFIDWINWVQAFLQNMIGKIVLFNNYYNKIVIATENEDP